MVIYKNFQKIEISQDLLKEINSEICRFQSFVYFDDNNLSFSIKTKENFYVILGNGTRNESLYDVLDYILESKNKSVAFSINQAQKWKFLNFSILYYIITNQECINIQDSCKEFKIDFSQYIELKNQVEAFKKSRLVESEIPSNLYLYYIEQYLNLLQQLYEKVVEKSRKYKNYEEIIWLHDNLYAPLLKNLFDIKNSGIKFNLFGLKKEKFSNNNLKSSQQKIINGIDHQWKLYPHYNPLISTTGRIGSSGTINFLTLQEELKNFIIPEESGNHILSFDYNALDLRVAFKLMEIDVGTKYADPKIKQYEDLYAYITKYIFDNEDENYERNFSEFRKATKQMVLQTLYTNDKDRKFNATSVELFWSPFTEWGELLKWIDDKVTDSYKQKYAKNYIGRVRDINPLPKRSVLANFYISPIANVIALNSLNLIHNYLKNGKGKILLFEHDSLILEFYQKDINLLKEDIKEVVKLMEEISPEQILKEKYRIPVRIKNMKG